MWRLGDSYLSMPLYFPRKMGGGTLPLPTPPVQCCFYSFQSCFKSIDISWGRWWQQKYALITKLPNFQKARVDFAKCVLVPNFLKCPKTLNQGCTHAHFVISFHTCFVKKSYHKTSFLNSFVRIIQTLINGTTRIMSKTEE